MSLRRLEQHGVRSSLPFLFLFSFSVLGCLLLPSACACSYYHAFSCHVAISMACRGGSPQVFCVSVHMSAWLF